MLKLIVNPAFDKLSTMFSKVDLGRALGDVAVEMAYWIERFSKQVTPVKTGRLRASISVSQGFGLRSFQAFIQPNTNYAYTVHEGKGFGKNATPRPFMRWGVEFTQQKFTEGNIADRLDKELRKQLSGTGIGGLLT